MFTLFDNIMLSSWFFMHLLVAFFFFLYISFIALIQQLPSSGLREQIIVSEDLMAIYEAGYSYMRRPGRSPSFDIFFHL